MREMLTMPVLPAALAFQAHQNQLPTRLCLPSAASPASIQHFKGQEGLEWNAVPGARTLATMHGQDGASESRC